jgi:hypothetical protein
MPSQRTIMIFRAIALALLLPLPAWAEKPMTGSEFEALTTGRTMDHATSGEVYGAEHYYPNRRVRWAFSGDDCMDGRWYEKGQMICFLYEDGSGPQCWTYFRDGAGIRAISAGDDPAAPASPVDMIATDRPLACLGPEVGV